MCCIRESTCSNLSLKNRGNRLTRLRPNSTITDAGFVTEVFNISGKGEEGGVVFGEMQGREQGSSDLMHLR